MEDRDEQLKRAARAYCCTNGPVEEAIEAAAVAAGWLPPKPAPTAGQAMAERMVSGSHSGYAFIGHLTSSDRALEVYPAPGEGDELCARLRSYIAAAIDEGIRLDRLARPAVDAEKVAEAFVREGFGTAVSVGGWTFSDPVPVLCVRRCRESLVTLIKNGSAQ